MNLPFSNIDLTIFLYFKLWNVLMHSDLVDQYGVFLSLRLKIDLNLTPDTIFH